MADKRAIYTFCTMQPESLAVLGVLQEKREKKTLTVREERQLHFLQERQEEGRIWLMPALIFAAANQAACRDFFLRASKEKRDVWQQEGVTWLRQYPSFLNRIGWQERQLAVFSAGLFTEAQTQGRDAMAVLRRFLAESWNFLWSRVKQTDAIGVTEWEELLSPWEDSPAMESAMAAVLLCAANLQKKPVRDIDQLWRCLRRLKHFSDNCIKKAEPVRRQYHASVREAAFRWPNSGKENGQQQMLDWLFAHFKNPQRPAYIREKGRISSEWLDTLFGVMEKAGLPRSACESMQIGGDEVLELLDCFTEKASERQYMTFLLLYTVSRELVKAGQAAAAGRNGLSEKI